MDAYPEEDEWLYLVNYYGQISKRHIETLAKRHARLIVDNAQAYFEEPVEGVDTIYTCRKYFGVPDGAFLYTDACLKEDLKRDVSWERFRHLLGRFEGQASDFYTDYVWNEEQFSKRLLMRMSRLTENLLRGIDYEFAKGRRTENYTHLDKGLRKWNLLDPCLTEGAFAYPLLLKNGAEVRRYLIAKHIYVPTLWPNVLKDMPMDSWEYNLSENLLLLPCDQRYDGTKMEFIVKTVMEMIGNYDND